jgi:hypothetical protein
VIAPESAHNPSWSPGTASDSSTEVVITTGPVTPGLSTVHDVDAAESVII